MFLLLTTLLRKVPLPLPVLLTREFYCRSCILLVILPPPFGCPLISYPQGYTSPEGSASSLACYTPLADSNINTAAHLWVSDRASAALTYGNINQWDVAVVTDMHGSESIRIVENGLTQRELICYCVIGMFRLDFGVGGDECMYVVCD
jgi:hypothetical protein